MAVTPVGDPRRHVVAIGGGGLSGSPGELALRDYLLELSGKANPRVCFVGTASGDDDGYAEAFRASFRGRVDHVSRLTLLRPMTTPLAEHLHEQDIIYVGGGSAFHMLVLWRSRGLDGLLRQAWERGAVMCGVSAGAMCWFDSGIRGLGGDAFEPLAPFLGLIPGSNCPHYDSQPARRSSYVAMVADGRLPAGCALGDGAAARFDGAEMAEVVTFGPTAGAFRVMPDPTGGIREDALPSRPLR